MNNRIKQLRQAAGLSQAALGDQLEVSRQTINAIENGRYDPSLPLAFKLSAVFGRPIEDLFWPDERPAGDEEQAVANRAD